MRAAWLCAAALVLAPAAFGQGILPGIRPGDDGPALPPFAPASPPEAPILPRVPMPGDAEAPELYGAATVEIREIHITGNTALPDSLLDTLAAPYTGRRLAFADLVRLRDLISLAYVERGYATSGATLPDQQIEDGVVEIRVIEGRLAEIDVQTSGRFRPGYFEKRLQARQSGVLNVIALREQLELFQLDARIRKVQASLEPAAERGLARLRVTVLEAPFYALEAGFDNMRSPAIGSLGSTGHASMDNALGVGDRVSVRFAASEGLGQFQARIAVPVNVWDTVFAAHYQYSEGDVVDGEFAALGIESESETVGFEIRQPLHRSPQASVFTSLTAEWRRSQSSFFDGAVKLDDVQASVLRWGVDASYRSRSQSMAFRSVLSWGIDVLGATQRPAGVPDGRFVAWLAQLQWAGRLPGSDAQLVARFDSQIASAPLLGLEQFAVGGLYTVRGYRDNAVVRDNGLAGSVELRLPIYQRRRPQIRIDLAPFFDVGRSWNSDERQGLINASPQTLASVGLGLRASAGGWGQAEIYWGRRREAIRGLGGDDLQDDGIQFRVAVRWP